MFKKTITNRIYEDLVKQIEQAIFEGQLKVGEKLPPQRELCDQFETSRGTVREALRVLEQKGLIEIKLGVNGGAIVKSPDATPLDKSISQLFRQQKVSLEEMMEFREGVQTIVAELATQKATKLSITELNALILDADSCIKKGISAWVELADLNQTILLLIFNMSQNFLYQSILETVQENIMANYKSSPNKTKSAMIENYFDLKNIVNAITTGDVNKCKKDMLDHVRRIHHFIRHNR